MRGDSDPEIRSTHVASSQIQFLDLVLVIVSFRLWFSARRVDLLANELQGATEGANGVFLWSVSCEGNVDDPRDVAGKQRMRDDEVFRQRCILGRCHDDGNVLQNSIRQRVGDVELQRVVI
jgi:hypothetical protein